jgi:hypothetical protein
MADLAIVICVFAPAREVFARTLAAVRALRLPPDAKVECVIVDNNNEPPLAQDADVAAFLATLPWARVVREPRQGLSHARLAGIAATAAASVIFFDDDNEPAPDYLLCAARALRAHPDVHAWGPGRVQVAFDPQVPQRYRAEFAGIFQQRAYQEVHYGCVPGRWEDYYPFGTGLVVRREVLACYVARVASGELGRQGRSGKKLGSAEDLQIVWEAIRSGKAAGVDPALAMTHVIPAHRATPSYVARLLYGTGASYLPAIVESFPGTKAGLARMNLGSVDICLKLAKILLRTALTGRTALWRVEIARFLGPSVGLLDAGAMPGAKPWVRRLAHKLGLE